MPVPFKVSIHAPVRERPAGKYVAAGRNGVSIHAPVRERPGVKRVNYANRMFQSTPP